MRVPSLLVLLPALVDGACSGGGCEDLRETERHHDVFVPWEEVEGHLGPDGTLSAEACAILCEQYASDGEVVEVLSCALSDGVRVTATDGTQQAVVDCAYVDRPWCIGGRHHAAVARPEGSGGEDGVLPWLKGMALAEANSVRAFVALAEELGQHGAPSDLVARCRASACDEVAHARVIGSLLVARGGAPEPLRFLDAPSRSLRALAVENVVEGCVMEVWAAAVAHWQARHACDAMVRRRMGPIARDEARHGELALSIHAWLMVRLDPPGRAVVHAAAADAVEALLESLERTWRGSHALGVPSRGEALGLATALFALLSPALRAADP